MSAHPAPIPLDAGLAIEDLPPDAAADAGRLHALAGVMRDEKRQVLGFPGNLDFSLEQLAPLLGMLFNNAEDPDWFDASDIGAKPYELAVLEHFIRPAGALVSDVYGYVSPSSSETLLHGLATARRRLPDCPVYASDQAHYSVDCACELLRMELVTVVPLPDRVMDAADLRLQVLLRHDTAAEAIVTATCRTTMHGAVDDIALPGGAAAGRLLAAHTSPQPRWSFVHGADSLNVSGYEILGLQEPAWVVEKWHLACSGDMVHLVAVGHVARAAVDELAGDLAGACGETAA
ncbi:hypothetical protein ACFYNX_26275 [Streptomyces sp. NPDC007872]|uniref:hypothetical protein n=1 Tax=Streptomyces sp. NPDC007872 TaxID=3364782 RepID=UPI003678F4FC